MDMLAYPDLFWQQHLVNKYEFSSAALNSKLVIFLHVGSTWDLKKICAGHNIDGFDWMANGSWALPTHIFPLLLTFIEF